MDKNSCAYFSTASIVIAVPIGAKVFTWLTTFMLFCFILFISGRAFVSDYSNNSGLE
ncbi:unnamed protein product [Dracunculus medinensis]|uniref:Cytochrome c oxidase polypeptide I n=1 Tax=Dracunculus medinensis TaxID=318479 RepID=A0A0N4US79_DRAME|nr:unnamed protein product [Dracunculus medinensis]